MEHREFVRLVPGADTAVLFIHGIVGTPNHFRDLLPLVSLVPEEWSVYNILLDGHGMGVEEFSSASMKKWKAQVWRVFQTLAQCHRRVVLVGHSMGTLFSMELALEYPEKIPFLFLIAVPMRPGVRLFGLINVMRLVFGRIREDRPLEVATRMVCGVRTTRKLWKYLGWVPRFLELFVQINRVEKKMSTLTVSCVSYQSEKDELVMNWSRKILERGGVMEVHNLMNSAHFYYHPDDLQLVQADFVRRCKEITHD